MKWVVKVFFQGLAALIPVALTFAVIIWLGVMVEGLVSHTLGGAIPTAPELLRMLKGLLAFVVIVFFFGLLMKLWLVRRVYEWVEARIIQIPLVKTVYGGIKDVIGMFNGKSGSKGDMVVMLTLENGWRQLGIVTRQDLLSCFPRELTNGNANLIAVYLPFSYQLGGFTYFIERDRCEPVPGMSVEDAMRLSIMGWMGSDEKREIPPVLMAKSEKAEKDKS